MGYKDGKLMFSTDQNVTSAVISENTLDTELTYPKLGVGKPIGVKITTKTVNTAGTGFSISIMHKTTVPSTDVILVTAVLLAAQLAVGKEVTIWLPTGVEINRHLAVWFARTGGTEDYVFDAELVVAG